MRSASRWLTLAVAVLAAMAVSVAAAFAAFVLLLGRPPADDESVIVIVALAGAVVAALVFRVTQPRLARAARRLAGTEVDAPSDLARSFSSRMSRSIALDELVLQAAEALRGSLRLSSAEVWIPGEGVLRPWIGDPGTDRPPVPLGGMDPATIVQAGLSGHGWLHVWLPQMLEGRDRSYVRLAPMANAGELLGVVVIERPVEDTGFTVEEERALVELARQLGVVLHNAKLDTALQASLDEVRRQAEELQASRGRIVAAADQARRTIERDLHDGAQQHVVALGIQLKLARTLMDKDPARAAEVLDGLAGAVDDTLQELRDLAHGIYPPLLADQGLAAALAAAARRSPQRVEVAAEGLTRHPPEAEATAYFCVLEALQNAGKYAGPEATVTVEVGDQEQGLVFVVSDDGSGFDVRQHGRGAGFTNMLDRLGALGGTLRVESAPGRGTRITGVVPSEQAPAAVPGSPPADVAPG